MADEIDFLMVSNPAPSPITEEELAKFLAVGKTWQVEEDEYEKEAERAYQLTEMAILDRQRGEIHQREAERDAREEERDQREADRDKREEERDASPDDFHDGWMKRTERARERDVREALRDTRKVERDKREEERKRCKKLADARRQAEMDRREDERDKREAERDRLAREVDLQAYKANGENRVTLVKAVRAQRASFDDRGENDDIFPDAYIKYLSGLSSASLLLHEHEKHLEWCKTNFSHGPSPEENRQKHKLLVQKVKEESQQGSFDLKIIEKACKLYKENEPRQYSTGWADKLATTCKQTGRYQHATKEKIDLFISENWFEEKGKNSIIFKKYVNMAKKENEQKLLQYQQKKAKKEIEQKLLQDQQKKKEDEDI